jgi:putative ABC transport system permease protein
MFQSFLRLAFRTLKRQIGTNALNIAGLTLGLSVSMILGAYCSNEYYFDSFNSNWNSIYKLWATVKVGSNQEVTDRFSAATAEEIKLKFPIVKSSVRIGSLEPAEIKTLSEFKSSGEKIIFSDPALFQIFSFKLKEGDPSSLLKPDIIFISESSAKRFFGDGIPSGKTLLYNDTLSLQVGGVFNDVPENSSIQFDLVVSFESLRSFKNYKSEFNDPKFGLGSFQTFFLIQDKDQANRLSNQLPEINEPFQINEYHFEPLNGAHVRNYGNVENKYVPIFATIAMVLFLFILMNSLNITSAQHIERTREIIIRKINGASRSSIVFLFYIETILISTMSITVSFIIAYTSVGSLQQVLGIAIDPNVLFGSPFVYYVIAAFLIMVGISGLYPALVLSTTRPILFFNQILNRSSFANIAKRSTLIFQFSISTILILGLLIIQKQVSYFKEKDLGLSTKEVLVLKLDANDAKSYVALRNSLKELSDVVNVGAASTLLFETQPPVIPASRVDSSNNVELGMMIADNAFIETLGISWVNENRTEKGLILNQTAARSFNLKFENGESQIKIGNRTQPVSGVVKDFNYVTLRRKINNLSISIADDSAKVFGFTGCFVYIKLNSMRTATDVIKDLERVYKEVFSKEPLSFSFLDDTFKKDFSNEIALINSFAFFTSLGILVGTFGLIGLLKFQMVFKMHEVSVRKLLGANLSQLTYFLSKEIVFLILTSLILGIPISVYFIADWLNSFPYRTAIDLTSILSSIGIILLITSLVMTFFIRKAATSNLIKFLKKD